MSLCGGSRPRTSIMATVLLIGLLMSALEARGSQVGVCNGRIGDNLPSEQDTVNLFNSNGITRMRIYDPNQATLQALRGTNIELMLGVANQNLEALANDQQAATSWVQANVMAFPDVKFRFIAVGNEVRENDPLAPFVVPAMQNIYAALRNANLNINVSTAIDMSLLGVSYPPSAGAFTESSAPYLGKIVGFLASTGAPLLANMYTYFSYIGNTKDIPLDYALINKGSATPVQDGPLTYTNLYDATLDALYTAVEKAGGANVEIVVSETGWPSEGDPSATVGNAAAYLGNLINHVSNNGTPKRPARTIETYLFAMFDENQKVGGETERHYGLFSPNQQPKYPIQIR
ncbi:hypothetical protein Tsubulata_029636 [Turnera subulata]|uniref:glucan endo-1,3-beta-D-glucosidase n=1 Tax=Turnera subulata TaxID=218843 RepID=A0A9Q0JFB9_9ROSI|nr:hypothetical protein Tsubulata_029636 [Turnera subulata]